MKAAFIVNTTAAGFTVVFGFMHGDEFVPAPYVRNKTYKTRARANKAIKDWVASKDWSAS